MGLVAGLVFVGMMIFYLNARPLMPQRAIESGYAGTIAFWLARLFLSIRAKKQ
jgi:hypothetical protein